MSLSETLDRLAAFEPSPYPVLSLYLNTQPGPQGRDQFQAFVRKELKARSRTYPRGLAGSREPRSRPGADRALSRNRAAAVGQRRRDLRLLGRRTVRDRSADRADRPALALHRRSATPLPARAARVAVSAIRRRADRHQQRANPRLSRPASSSPSSDVKGVKTRRHLTGRLVAGALSAPHRELPPASRQGSRRHARSHRAGAKASTQIVLSGDEVITPLLREQMPKHLAEKIVDHLQLEAHATHRGRPAGDAGGDAAAEHAQRPRKSGCGDRRLSRRRPRRRRARRHTGGAHQGSGRRAADHRRHCSELRPAPVGRAAGSASERRWPSPPSSPSVGRRSRRDAQPEVVRLADELVTKAKQTSARITLHRGQRAARAVRRRRRAAAIQRLSG